MNKDGVNPHKSDLPSDRQPASDPDLDRFSYNDQTVRMFALAAVFWGLLSASVGAIVAALLVMPQLAFVEFFSFARLRPLHTNAVIFAFGGNAIFAAIYYSTQRLCKARMWSDLLGKLHFWGWQLIIIAAVVTLPLGITQGKEYAELEWPIDIAIAIVWIGFFGVNFFMTLKNRRERHMYVSLWFYIASVVTVAILHVVNNIVVPVDLFKSVPVFAGAQDAMLQAWYGHNLVTFLLTIPFLGVMYYFLPKAVERPVFSYKLCVIHFWSLLLICIWAGPRQLHYTSIATWASSLGMVFSLMLWMPSWGGVINGLLTLKGAWAKVKAEPVLKFFVAGILLYGLTTLEETLLSIKSINALSQYTDWSSAYINAGAAGWCGFMAFGMVYWLLPRIFQTKLWSTKLATLHFYLASLGILFYLFADYAAGSKQGYMWQAMTSDGNLAYPEFINSIEAVVPMWWARVAGGLLFVSGALLLAFNSLKTWQSKPEQYDVPVIESVPLDENYEGAPATSSRIKGGVLEIAHKLDIFEQANWHRSWERFPMKFTAIVIAAVAFASAAQLIPTVLIGSDVEAVPSVKPYTPLELMGRDIYVAEGCHNCHSQQIRPLVAETERYGEYSKAGEFVFDRPYQWGSRRIGPDLSREGGKQSNIWHFEHFENPTSKTTGSLMPSFDHLITRELNLESLQDRLEAATTLGTPYTERELEDCVNIAREQAKKIAFEVAQQDGPMTVTSESGEKLAIEKTQIIALIAYMQRLGTDLYASGDEEKQYDLSEEQQASFDKYKEMLSFDVLDAADAYRGRKIFTASCGKCHELLGEGGKVGPNLTGANRSSLDFLILNSVAPSLEVPEAYRTEIVLTLDGDLYSGIIAEEDEEILVLKTADNPRVEILQEDVEERKTSDLSIMPTGQLDQLKPEEVADLMKYLQQPKPLEPKSEGESK